MKLLVAEDDTLIREALVDILSAEGFECVPAIDGVSAWEKYQQTKPDMVLLDIMMPGLDGYAVCRQIRQHDQHTAVMFISAKSEEIDRVLGLELGADDYLMKPFGKHEVLARVRAIFRRYNLAKPAMNQEDGESQAFTMHSLVIDPAQLRASRDNRQFDLSLRDCAILNLLYQNSGKVISRDELFNQCWGRDYLPSSRTLDQHISQLRKLIEIDPKTPSIITTVHGVGYRFDSKLA
ncbi:MAG: response regulator transcription factor [Arenicella sp.]|nr:response regulator transcription factor [Arenicella sp.]